MCGAQVDGPVAQLARVPVLQSGGQEFESPRVHRVMHSDESRNKKSSQSLIHYWFELIFCQLMTSGE